MNAHAQTFSGRTVAFGRPGGKAPIAVQHTPQRRDVQGLRALAVVAVIVNHLYGGPSGGFVGVDVFFVISGFLISGLLMREVQASGRINFTRFYARRARRIIPVAVLVVAVTVAAAYALYNSGRGDMVRGDGIFSVLFAANWHFAAVGTDYWQADGIVSPLQHYWSLAVEEQFYLFWPWLIIGSVWAGRKFRGKNSVTVVPAVLMGSVAAASFIFALWQVAAAPTWAYFSTFTRTWELGVGALVALAVPFLKTVAPVVRDSAAVLGLLAVILSLIVINSGSGIPAPGALLPVLGAAMVIAGGVGRNPRTMFLLTNPVSQYVGKVSYSLYLWHFPVIILLRSYFPNLGISYYLTALALMFVLSILSFHLVEDPIRRSHLLERTPASGPSDGVVPSGRLDLVRWKPAVLAAQGVLTVILAAVLVMNPGGFGGQGSASEVGALSDTSAPSGGPAESSPTKSASPEENLAADITAALSADDFPELTPPLETLGTKNWINEVNSEGCAEIAAGNVDSCAMGPEEAAKTVAVLGDSYAIAWLPGLREAVQTLGYRLVPLTKGQCPSASVAVTRDGGTEFRECDAHREWALDALKDIQPDLLILADADNTITRLASGAGSSESGEDGAAELEAGLAETIRAARVNAVEVAILSPPPAGRNLQDCVTRVGSPVDCTAKISALWRTMQLAQQNAASEAGARYISTDQWFCDVDGQCPGFVNGIPVRADTSHLTTAYSRSLATVLVDAIGG
ncbi:peptidoglycan/LPS O-acetylase OafA/YrhL [Arthrobacter sp. UYP6]|uniref:acyltransferase family protein n=1 Tax=Arthrobacter sp. UYP6 TaxID=1756378 RepID=UPI003399EA33